jgi:hypothetical protein
MTPLANTFYAVTLFLSLSALMMWQQRRRRRRTTLERMKRSLNA